MAHTTSGSASSPLSVSSPSQVPPAQGRMEGKNRLVEWIRNIHFPKIGNPFKSLYAWYVAWRGKGKEPAPASSPRVVEKGERQSRAALASEAPAQTQPAQPVPKEGWGKGAKNATAKDERVVEFLDRFGKDANKKSQLQAAFTPEDIFVLAQLKVADVAGIDILRTRLDEWKKTLGDDSETLIQGWIVAGKFKPEEMAFYREKNIPLEQAQEWRGLIGERVPDFKIIERWVGQKIGLEKAKEWVGTFKPLVKQGESSAAEKADLWIQGGFTDPKEASHWSICNFIDPQIAAQWKKYTTPDVANVLSIHEIEIGEVEKLRVSSTDESDKVFFDPLRHFKLEVINKVIGTKSKVSLQEIVDAHYEAQMKVPEGTPPDETSVWEKNKTFLGNLCKGKSYQTCIAYEVIPVALRGKDANDVEKLLTTPRKLGAKADPVPAVSLPAKEILEGSDPAPASATPSKKDSSALAPPPSSPLTIASIEGWPPAVLPSSPGLVSPPPSLAVSRPERSLKEAWEGALGQENPQQKEYEKAFEAIGTWLEGGKAKGWLGKLGDLTKGSVTDQIKGKFSPEEFLVLSRLMGLGKGGDLDFLILLAEPSAPGATSDKNALIRALSTKLEEWKATLPEGSDFSNIVQDWVAKGQISPAHIGFYLEKGVDFKEAQKWEENFGKDFEQIQWFVNNGIKSEEALERMKIVGSDFKRLKNWHARGLETPQGLRDFANAFKNKEGVADPKQADGWLQAGFTVQGAKEWGTGGWGLQPTLAAKWKDLVEGPHMARVLSDLGVNPKDVQDFNGSPGNQDKFFRFEFDLNVETLGKLERQQVDGWRKGDRSIAGEIARAHYEALRNDYVARMKVSEKVKSEVMGDKWEALIGSLPKQEGGEKSTLDKIKDFIAGETVILEKPMYQLVNYKGLREYLEGRLGVDLVQTRRKLGSPPQSPSSPPSFLSRESSVSSSFDTSSPPSPSSASGSASPQSPSSPVSVTRTTSVSSIGSVSSNSSSRRSLSFESSPSREEASVPSLLPPSSSKSKSKSLLSPKGKTWASAGVNGQSAISAFESAKFDPANVIRWKEVLGMKGSLTSEQSTELLRVMRAFKEENGFDSRKALRWKEALGMDGPLTSEQATQLLEAMQAYKGVKDIEATNIKSWREAFYIPLEDVQNPKKALNIAQNIHFLKNEMGYTGGPDFREELFESSRKGEKEVLPEDQLGRFLNIFSTDDLRAYTATPRDKNVTGTSGQAAFIAELRKAITRES